MSSVFVPPDTSEIANLQTQILGSGSFRNRLLNGNVDVWMRGAGFSVASTGDMYTTNNWKTYNGASSAMAVSKIAAPVGFKGVSALDISVAANAGEAFSIYQRMEAHQIADLDSKESVLSLDIDASTSAGSLRAFLFLYSNSAPDNGTWSVNTLFSQFTLPLGAGRVVIPISGAQMAGAKNGLEVGLYFDQNGAAGNVNIKLGAIQFEADRQIAGNWGNPTPFEFRPLPLEFALCQRYFETSYPPGIAPGTVTPSSFMRITEYLSSYPSLQAPFKVAKRATPTVVLYGPATGATGKMALSGSDVAATPNNVDACGFVPALDGVSASTGSLISSHWTASAEL